MKILNSANEKLQSKNLEIQHLKRQITICIESIARLVVVPSKLYSGIETLSKVQWKNSEVQKDWFVDNDAFLGYIAEKFGLDQFLPSNKSISDAKKREFCSFFKSYIAEILTLFAKKLPLSDKAIDIIDFVELKDEFHIIEQKIKSFAKMFSLIPANKYIELENELHDLHKRGFYAQKVQAQTKNKEGKIELSTMKLWSLIQESNNYIHLPIIFKFAQSLPCSSANVEQTFSRIKHIKSYARNKLSTDSLEALLLITEEFRKKEIIITEKMVETYKKLRDTIKERKGGTEASTSQTSKYIDIQTEETKILKDADDSKMIIEEKKEKNKEQFQYEEIDSNEEDFDWSEDEEPNKEGDHDQWISESKIFEIILSYNNF